MATCYRHPDRETGVSCSNCGRPICPDCMTTTSVGMRCPECAREKTKVRTGTAAFGRAGATSATTVLIAINVIVFLIEIGSGSGGLNGGGNVIDNFSVFAPKIADGEWYRVLTGGFLHAGLLHIAFNMYALYLFGPPLESTLGRVRFLSLYLVSAVGGTAASYAFNAPNQGSLGASGAVFGLFGAFFIVNRKFGRDNSGLLVLLAINLAFAFLPGTNIDWHAHVGGLVTGSLVASALVYAPRNRRTVVQTTGCVVVLLMVVALVVWRTAQLT